MSQIVHLFQLKITDNEKNIITQSQNTCTYFLSIFRSFIFYLLPHAFKKIIFQEYFELILNTIKNTHVLCIRNEK
jgi:hypothetical protein